VSPASVNKIAIALIVLVRIIAVSRCLHAIIE
jgi:hypothetical protein